jgi:uncharacterized metal-binding protein
VTAPPQLPARFEPLRRPSRTKRRLLFLIGPLLWLVAIAVLALVIHLSSAVVYAVLVLVASFAVSLPVLGWMRIARVREEQRAEA